MLCTCMKQSPPRFHQLSATKITHVNNCKNHTDNHLPWSDRAAVSWDSVGRWNRVFVGEVLQHAAVRAAANRRAYLINTMTIHTDAHR